MGYTTEFDGFFEFNRKLTDEEYEYLTRFSETRRMKRNPDITETFRDPVRLAVGLPIGEKACFYVGSDHLDNGRFGQNQTEDIIDYNSSGIMPGLWCQWIPDARTLVWNGGEKFYYYVEWLIWLRDNIFERWDLVLNGKITYQGENKKDRGSIEIENNNIFHNNLLNKTILIHSSAKEIAKEMILQNLL